MAVQAPLSIFMDFVAHVAAKAGFALVDEVGPEGRRWVTVAPPCDQPTMLSVAATIAAAHAALEVPLCPEDDRLVLKVMRMITGRVWIAYSDAYNLHQAMP